MRKIFYCAALWVCVCTSQLALAQEDAASDSDGIIDYRMRSDLSAVKNPFAISQHHQNYLLPVTYVTNPNSLGNANLTPENVDNTEAKFQISVKTPLFLNDEKAGGMYFGFTLASFWQLYNDEVSKPFRETNYEPELFWQQNTDINVLGYTFNSIQAGFNHMSNGQSGDRSRSWNRLFASLLFSSKENLYYIKAWYRIPEDRKTSPNDASGDDNPDITDYYGRMEFGYGTRFGDLKVLALLRNNLSFSNNRGSIQLNVNYPLSNRYDLMLQYFNGYGDSLIDYNRSQERIGIGFSLKFL